MSGTTVISGNTSRYGGGVGIDAIPGEEGGPSFEMSGSAEISGNTASTSAGGVYVGKQSRFTMTGGVIYGSNAGTLANNAFHTGSAGTLANNAFHTGSVAVYAAPDAAYSAVAKTDNTVKAGVIQP
jgi:hypothetical protein